MDNNNAPAPSLRAAAWFPLLVIALLAVCIAFCVQFYMAMKTQGEFLQDQLTITEIRAKALANQLEGERIIQNTRARLEAAPAFKQLNVIPLRAHQQVSGAPQLIALWDHAAQQGMLIVNGRLEPIAEGGAYHIWISSAPSASPLHAGQILLSSNENSQSYLFVPSQPVSVFSGITITRELISNPTTPSLPAVFSGE